MERKKKRRTLMRGFFRWLGCGFVGAVLGSLIATVFHLDDNTCASIGGIIGLIVGAALILGNSPTVQLGRAMRDGDGAASLARAVDKGAVQPVPPRLAHPCGHGEDRVLVTTALLTDMYDEDIALQSQRLEALLRDAAKAVCTDRGFGDCITGTFTSPGSSVVAELRIARWEFPEGPGAVIGHNL
ncbi:hypothetical protein [Streptomyces sp. URMC 125]|jgi:uncharacterized membrane protein YeaQ/YmgE (transglycosylase-associated protein family)|uniref:hypothetical protein n=1 Tax=Streptomyces sp. URMC 125 TaxID=3423419 RepID=UPI003F1AE252